MSLQKFGRRLSYLRVRAGLTQEELAEKAKMSVDHLSRMERGKNFTTLKKLESIAEALGISVKELFDY